MYYKTNTPRPPIFSLFTGTFHRYIKAYSNWNNNNDTKGQTCKAVSFIPFWAKIDNAATSNAPGDYYLKPGPQTKSKLEDTNNTYATLLRF